MLNIVCTSKPCDGLFYYSYEYCSHLNEKGIRAQVYVVTHRDFTSGDYTESINDKYIHCENIVFNNDYIEDGCTSLILGRSMMTLAHMAWNDYRPVQQESLKKLFSNNVISVYSENHPKKYPKALKFFKPKKVIDLCDTDVYPKGVGAHFEKIIHFPIYKEVEEDIQFDHLFLGTNPEYYESIEKIISDYPDHGILTYHQNYINFENNNLKSPVPNLLGKFKTYVYTKDTFDPAPRLFQEARWLGKEIIYHRKNPTKDGGYWYWKRGLKQQDLEPIFDALDALDGKIKLETQLVKTNTSQIGTLEPADNVDFFTDKLKLINEINDEFNHHLDWGTSKGERVWFCSMPYRTPFRHKDGKYSPCSIGKKSEKEYDSIEDWMTSEELNNIRKDMLNLNDYVSDGWSEMEIHSMGISHIGKYCETCVNAERREVISKRISSNHQYQDLHRNKWDSVINSATKIMRGQEYKIEGRMLEVEVWDDSQYNQIIELSKKILKIKYNDGPSFELIKGLVDKKQAKEIELRIDINNRILDCVEDELAKFLYFIPYFKKVIIDVAIDGIGIYNDYLNRTSNYKSIKKRIDELSKYENVVIHLHSKVNFLSVLRLYEIQSFLGKYNHYWLPDNEPSVMKCNNLPHIVKSKLIQKYAKGKAVNLKGIADILKQPEEEDFSKEKLYKYLMSIDDKYKGTEWEMNLFEIYPELKSEYFYLTHKPKNKRGKK